MGVLLFEDCLAEAVWPGMALERGGEGEGGGGVASFKKKIHFSCIFSIVSSVA